MSSAAGQSLGGLGQLAELERALLGRIHSACDDLQRIECLDEEQRAEIHAILEAMRHDGESHASILAGLAREVGHA